MTGIQTQTKDNGHLMATPAPASTMSDSPKKKGPSIHQIYSVPAPIRTFPLPAFYPDNPVSLFAVAYAWLRQTIFPPPPEPSVVHQGIWSEATNSVHITDERSVRALWEQGFYGKGSLSRSEPNWLKREQVRRGQQDVHVSEVLTLQRREERAQAKWERARVEQEAIRQTKLREAQLAGAETRSRVDILLPGPPRTAFAAPVGPLELLSLPNSTADATSIVASCGVHGPLKTAGPASEGDVISESADLVHYGTADADLRHWRQEIGRTAGISQSRNLGAVQDGTDKSNAQPQSFVSETGSSHRSIGEKPLRRQKSVRFSPQVESATFNLTDPPSPDSSPNGGVKQPLPNGEAGNFAAAENAAEAPLPSGSIAPDQAIINKEHLQLMPEEAFFLMFGFGALSVIDPASGRHLSVKELLLLFRQHSYFPPRREPDDADLEPDDGFLVHYAVYHHFRSLGWVPRGGIKFGVDWMLYTRGPVFDHAEFGLMVIPSYSDPWWKAKGKKASSKTWPWLHSVVRVLSHVMKSLVLVYVEIPPPPQFEATMDRGFAQAMKLYKIQEIMVKRWSSNRNR